MRRIIILASLALVAGSPVCAQGSNRDYGRPLDTLENRADGAMRGAGRCVAMRVPASVRRVLEASIASSEEEKRVNSLIGVARECFQPQWPAFPPTIFRNVLAEAIYREHFQRADPSIERKIAMPASFGVAPLGTKGSDVQDSAWQLAAIANCVVFTDPRNARELVIGPRNVEEEARRYGLLKPAMRECLGPRDSGGLTERNFRGFIANALLVRAQGAGEGK